MAATPNESSRVLCDSQMDFALRVLHHQPASKAYVFSPLTIAAAVALVHAGSKGDTKDEIRDVLMPGATHQDFEQHLSAAVMSLLGSKCVNLASHVFYRKDININEPYLERVKKMYGSGATPLDFDNGIAASEAINGFVNKTTKGFIKQIIGAKDIDKESVAVIANALYFKSDWFRKFQKNYTRTGTFYNSKSSSRPIQFMSAIGPTYFTENNLFEVLTLHYEDTAFRLNILLPKARFGLTEALERIDGATIRHLITPTKPRTLIVELPKWRTESGTDLKHLLGALGMKKLFDGAGDLTDIADDMRITSSFHKAIIDVDEEGTTAAAATGIAVGGCPVRDKFTADHPFLYILAKKQLPLFVGIYA